MALCGLLASPQVARAAADGAVAELRNEIQQMKRDYEARIRALEDRVQEAEGTARRAASQAARSEAPPPPLAPARSRSANAFNPAVSMILQGRYAAFGGQEGQRQVPGYLLGEETGRGPKGFSLGESELDISANIDDRFYGFFDVAFNQENGDPSFDVEEAYLQTLALPAGFTLKAGQFFSAIGYQNSRHSHTWDFIDQPLAYEAMLNTQLSDAGVQLRWVAPTDAVYLELGSEAFAGVSYPTSGRANGGVGSAAFFAKMSGDIGDSSTWKAGVSYLMTDPRDRESTGSGAAPLRFTGDSDIAIADFVWKWSPHGNFRERNFIFQAEYLHRHEKGRLRQQVGAAALAGRYRGDQDGFYVQGAYQFMPRWRVGLRYGQLFSSNNVSGVDAPSLARDGLSPWRASAMLDFSNSEFSRLRLQYSHEGAGLGNDNLLFLQYIMSIGSHGAHQF